MNTHALRASIIVGAMVLGATRIVAAAPPVAPTPMTPPTTTTASPSSTAPTSSFPAVDSTIVDGYVQKLRTLSGTTLHEIESREQCKQELRAAFPAVAPSAAKLRADLDAVQAAVDPLLAVANGAAKDPVKTFDAALQGLPSWSAGAPADAASLVLLAQLDEGIRALAIPADDDWKKDAAGLRSTTEAAVNAKRDAALAAIATAAVSLDQSLVASAIAGLPAPDPAAVSTARTALETKTTKDLQCRRNDVLCLNGNGALWPGERGLIGRVDAASNLVVHVIVPVDAYVEHTFTVKLGQIERTSELAPALPEKTTQAGELCVTKTAAEVGFRIAKSEVLVVPDDPKVRFAVVELERVSKDAKEKVEARHSAKIEHGKYYVDVGLLVPFVHKGKQTVSARTEGSAQRVVLDRQLHVTAALALNVFPFGRRKDAISPFEDLSCAPDLECEAKKKCKRRRGARPFAELIGLQVGADLDVTPMTDQFYFGAVLEPLTGLSFSTGVALIEVDGLASGVARGQLVTSPADVKGVPHHRARWYGGFTLSLDVIRLVQQARARLKDAS